MVEGGTASHGQPLQSTHDVMQDSSSLSIFYSLSMEHQVMTMKKTIALMHSCNRKDFFMNSGNAALGWNAQSLGLKKKVNSAMNAVFNFQ